MKKRSVYLLLIPGLIVILLFLFLPILNTTIPTFFQSKQLTIKKYVDFFKDDYYMSILIRTIRISLVTTTICIVLGVPTSYYIAKSSKKMKGILLAAAIFPQLTDSVVRSFAWGKMEL